MALISIREVSLGFGGPLLLKEVNLQIERGEMIGLLGRNGTGKSTLLKLINGDIEPHSGGIARQQSASTAYMPQEVPHGFAGRIFDIVASGLKQSETDEESWQQQLQVEQVISRMQLEPEARFDALSAGLKRRVLLARGLVRKPDLLLLDEPTNHLDILAIHWLENFLKRWEGTLLFVTHDRAFLQKLSTRIVKIDRGHLNNWNCSYTAFIKRREVLLAAEKNQNASFDKKLIQEEAWIRKGIEARRTRNEGRVRALKRLREQRLERQERPGKSHMQIQEARRSGHLVIEVKNIHFEYEQPILNNFSTTIQRGDKVGIIGPNGSGKTTLLRLLLNEIPPLAGEVHHGTNLEVAYFDQLRIQLDESKSLLDNVGQGRDSIIVNGKQRNLVGYLKDFLFSSDRIHAPISTLSGGERSRLLLARLLAQPANLLVMDEPTNDLDLETLELLEDLLLEFSGTLLLVSHDRAFLNNLVTSTIVLNGNGEAEEFVGGYDNWQHQILLREEKKISHKLRKSNPIPLASSTAPDRLSYKEKRAFEAQKKMLAELPGRIETLEDEQQLLTAAMADTAFYQQDRSAIASAADRLKKLEDEITAAYKCWEDLGYLEN